MFAKDARSLSVPAFKSLVSLAALSLLAPISAFADVDSCDDYVSRHYRADLVVDAARVTEVPGAGEFGPYQHVVLTVRNVGEVQLDARVPCDNPDGCLINTRSISAKIGGYDVQTWLPEYIPQGQSTELFFSLRGGSLTSCTQPIVLDTYRSAGQWGCRVFANDTSRIVAQFTNGSCFDRIRIPTPFPFP